MTNAVSRDNAALVRRRSAWGGVALASLVVLFVLRYGVAPEALYATGQPEETFQVGINYHDRQQFADALQAYEKSLQQGLRSFENPGDWHFLVPLLTNIHDCTRQLTECEEDFETKPPEPATLPAEASRSSIQGLPYRLLAHRSYFFLVHVPTLPESANPVLFAPEAATNPNLKTVAALNFCGAPQWTGLRLRSQTSRVGVDLALHNLDVRPEGTEAIAWSGVFPADPNLLQNASFEDTAPAPFGWHPDVQSNALLDRDHDTVAEGLRSLRVSLKPNGELQLIQHAKITSKPHVFTGWVRGNVQTPGVQLRVEVVDSVRTARNWEAQHAIEIPLDEWKRFRFEFTPKDNVHTIKVTLATANSSPANAAALWLDGLYLQQQ